MDLNPHIESHCWFYWNLNVAYVHCLYLFWQAGAQVDAKDKDLRTPLLEAIINNHAEVAQYLIQNGACVYHTVSVFGCLK